MFSVPFGLGGPAMMPTDPGEAWVGNLENAYRTEQQPEAGHTFQSYRKVKALEKGGMSQAVNLLKGCQDGKLYVEKRVRTDGIYGKRASAELATLKRCRGQDHLNQLVEYKVPRPGLVSFVLQYCDGGSIEDEMMELASRGYGGFQEVAIWNVAAGVSQALAFLHNGIGEVGRESARPGWNTMCHLDIKPCNIFLSSSGGVYGQQRVVLADFGCAVSLADVRSGRESDCTQECGTPEWYPPEGFAGGGRQTSYGTKTDMYMLGATMHAICTMNLQPNQVVLASGVPCGEVYSHQLNQLVSRLSQYDFSRRPPAPEVAVEALQCFEFCARRG